MRISLADEHEHAQRVQVVGLGASELAVAGADPLELEYSGANTASAPFTDPVSTASWTLLGGSDTGGGAFGGQLLIASRPRASAFIAGWAIRAEALALEPEEQAAWLQQPGRPRVERLAEIVDTYPRRIP